jgi:chromosome segregation ATPase
MSPRMFVALALALALGCACTPAPSIPAASSPRRTKPTADELFVQGRYADAVREYERELERGERVAELQLFKLFAKLASDVPGWQLVDELRTLEQTYPRSRWGHLAGVLASEIDRGTVLRQAVMAAGADLRAAEERVAELTQKVTALTTQTAEQQTTISTLREERGRLQQQVRELEEAATSRDARIRELEAELAALKQVDMQRSP